MEFKVGDVVKLTSTRPVGWNSSGRMDHFLGQVVKIIHIGDGNRSRTFQFEGGGSWEFSLTDIECKMESEELRIEASEFVTNPNTIFDIAKEVFGESRVDMKIVDEKTFDLVVYFPEITITNSEGTLHDIKDLYVRFNINIDVHRSAYSCIDLFGRRATISDYEFRSDYGHSHFSGRGLSSYSRFCLGSSEYAMIINSMKFSLKEEDWFLLFFSLENYVSWESLEGGPYRRIREISLGRNFNREQHRVRALLMFNELPNECLTITDNRLQLIEDHPALFNHYNAKSLLRKFDGTSIESFENIKQSFNSEVQGIRIFKFKNNTITPRLYQKHQTAEPTDISADVCSYFNSVLNEELRKYNLSYEYNKLRSSEIFREVTSF